MSISFDHLLIKHSCDIKGPLKEQIASGPFLTNGHFYLLTADRTFHYEAIKTGNYEKYTQYIKEARDKTHTAEKFKALVDDFMEEKAEKIVANIYGHTRKYWVQDGNHRLAIYKAKQLWGNAVPLSKLQLHYYPDVQEILKTALKNTVADKHANGWHNRTEYGYHSFHIQTIDIEGQRNPVRRFEKIKPYYDFTGKTVLDLGCNTGGMLFHIPEIKRGMGIDFDERCIQSCNVWKDWLMFTAHYSFHQMDLNQFTTKTWLAEHKIQTDIIFLLSIGSWVSNWRQLYTSCFECAPYLLLETNNDKEGAPQLELFRELGGTITCVAENSDDDMTGNVGRKTYLVRTVQPSR